MQIGDGLGTTLFKSTQIDTNADSEDYRISKYRECWAIDSRELYTIDTGSDPVECYKLLQEYTEADIGTGLSGRHNYVSLSNHLR